jgi:hypothetical protein
MTIESLPPKPIETARKKFGVRNETGDGQMKKKHLFLNEDDVDTYITYPPKENEAPNKGVPLDRQGSSCSIGLSPLPHKDSLLHIQDSKCMMSKKPKFNHKILMQSLEFSLNQNEKPKQRTSRPKSGLKTTRESKVEQSKPKL